MLVALILTRKGSKGVPGKNCSNLLGFTLLERTLSQIERSALFDRIIVSTDCDDCVKLAKKFDVIVDERPAALATDETSSGEVCRHLVANGGGVIQLEDMIVLIEVTYPFRSLETLVGFVDTALGNENVLVGSCSQVAVVGSRETLVGPVGREYRKTIKGEPSRRQNRPKWFYVAGGMYAFTARSLGVNRHSIISGDSAQFEVSWVEGFDINEKADIEIARILIKGGICDYLLPGV